RARPEATLRTSAASPPGAAGPRGPHRTERGREARPPGRVHAPRSASGGGAATFERVGPAAVCACARVPKTSALSALSAGLALLLGDLRADLVHVERLDLADDLLQRLAGERAGLVEQEDAVAERHQRGDRLDAGGRGQLPLVLGVDLAEHDVVVLL